MFNDSPCMGILPGPDYANLVIHIDYDFDIIAIMGNMDVER